MRSSGPLFIAARPPFYTIDWLESRISVEGAQSNADWDAVFAAVKRYELSKLFAPGISEEALGRLPDLTHLQIAGSREVTNQGLKNLARLSRLQYLELGGAASPITDQGLGVLSHLSGLRVFQACWTPGLTDSGMADLARCNQLEDVNLLGTSTGDGAIRALMGKPNLRRFQSGRNVSDAGLALLHQFPVYRSWHGGSVDYGLMSASAEPNFLLVDGPFTDRGLASLSGLEGLFALSLFWHTPGFTSQGLAPLKDLPNLGFLGCQNDHCDDEAMRQIADFPHLRMLMGQGAVAGDAGFAALSKSQTVEYIWGRECPNLTGSGLAALAAMPALKGLAVTCKQVDDDSLSKLERFPKLREFMPMGVNDSGFRHIGRCENLEALWCMYCRDTGDKATSYISSLPKLKTYYAGKTNITDRSLEILSRMSSLERVELWECAGVTDQGLRHLADLPRLQELNLQGMSQITRQAAAAFPSRVRVRYARAVTR